MRSFLLMTALLVVFSGCGPDTRQPAVPEEHIHPPLPPGAGLDLEQIEILTGLKGTFDEVSGVFKVTAPRNDVAVSVDSWPMPPFMGRTSWVGFQSEGKDGVKVMAMGDLVLFQDEVNPVMSVWLDAGLEVTALHNHFFYDEPKQYFMHISGEATQEYLAKVVKRALDKIKEIRTANPAPAKSFGPAEPPPKNEIDAGAIEKILGVKPQVKDGMCKVVIGRTVKMACGCAMGKEMGVNTWAAFAGTDRDAIVDGDFAVREEELQKVLLTLRIFNINIVAIHHHMTGETPRMIFLHYWGRGSASTLASGIKTALGELKN